MLFFRDVLLVSAKPTTPFVMRASSSKSPTQTNASAARGTISSKTKFLVLSVLLPFQDVLLVSAKPTAPFVTLKPTLSSTVLLLSASASQPSSWITTRPASTAASRWSVVSGAPPSKHVNSATRPGTSRGTPPTTSAAVRTLTTSSTPLHPALFAGPRCPTASLAPTPPTARNARKGTLRTRSAQPAATASSAPP